LNPGQISRGVDEEAEDGLGARVPAANLGNRLLGRRIASWEQPTRHSLEGRSHSRLAQARADVKTGDRLLVVSKEIGFVTVVLGTEEVLHAIQEV
jgi:hypothetical protein